MRGTAEACCFPKANPLAAKVAELEAELLAKRKRIGDLDRANEQAYAKLLSAECRCECLTRKLASISMTLAD